MIIFRQTHRPSSNQRRLNHTCDYDVRCQDYVRKSPATLITACTAVAFEILVFAFGLGRKVANYMIRASAGKPREAEGRVRRDRNPAALNFFEARNSKHVGGRCFGAGIWTRKASTTKCNTQLDRRSSNWGRVASCGQGAHKHSFARICLYRGRVRGPVNTR